MELLLADFRRNMDAQATYEIHSQFSSPNSVVLNHKPLPALDIVPQPAEVKDISTNSDDNARSELAALKNKFTNVHSEKLQLDAMLATKLNEYAELEKERDALKAKLDLADKTKIYELEQLQTQLSAVSRDKDYLAGQLETRIRESTRVQKELDESNQALARLQEVEQAAVTVGYDDSAVQLIRQESEQKSVELQLISAELERLRASYDERSEEHTSLKAQVASMTVEVERLTRSYDDTSEELQRANQAVVEARLNNEQVGAQKTLELQGLKMQVGELTLQRNTLEERCVKYEDEIDMLRQQLEVVAQLRVDASESTQQVAALQQQLAAATQLHEQDKKAYAEELAELRLVVAAVPGLQQRNLEYKQQVLALQAQVERVDELQRDLESSAARLVDQEGAVAQLEQHNQRYAAEVAQLKGQVALELEAKQEAELKCQEQARQLSDLASQLSEQGLAQRRSEAYAQQAQLLSEHSQELSQQLAAMSQKEEQARAEVAELRMTLSSAQDHAEVLQQSMARHQRDAQLQIKMYQDTVQGLKEQLELLRQEQNKIETEMEEEVGTLRTRLNESELRSSQEEAGAAREALLAVTRQVTELQEELSSMTGLHKEVSDLQAALAEKAEALQMSSLDRSQLRNELLEVKLELSSTSQAFMAARQQLTELQALRAQQLDVSTTLEQALDKKSAEVVETLRRLEAVQGQLRESELESAEWQAKTVQLKEEISAKQQRVHELQVALELREDELAAALRAVEYQQQQLASSGGATAALVEVEQQLAVRDADMAATREALASKEREVASLQTQLHTTRDQMSALRGQLQQSQRQCETLRSDLVRRQQQVKAVRDNLLNADSELGQLASGNVSTVKLWETQEHVHPRSAPPSSPSDSPSSDPMWTSLVTELLQTPVFGGKYLAHAAIIDHDGAPWQLSSAFPRYKKYEISQLVHSMNNPAELFTQGVLFAGHRFSVEEVLPHLGFVAATVSGGGLVACRTKYALVIAMFQSPVTAKDCQQLVQGVASQLAQKNY